MFDRLKQYKEMARAYKNALKTLMSDESARVQGNIFGKIVGLFVIAIMVGTVFVVGVQELENANTTGLSTTEITLLGVVGLVLIVAVIWVILEYVGIV